MKKSMIIILLLAGFLCVATFEEYDYDTIGMTIGEVTTCKEAGAALGNDLRVIAMCIIQIHNDTGKKTNIICSWDCDRQFFKVTTWYPYTVNWKWENRNVTMALLAMRKNNRENENPVVFYSAQYEHCKTSETGTGDDFSEMHHENPFRPGNITVILTKRGKGTVATLLKFVPDPDCYKTDTWIANEGWYVLDKDSRTWYPIYFDPNSDQAFFF